MNLFGFNIPIPVLIIFLLLLIYMGTRKRKISSLRKEDDRLDYEISIAKKKHELKTLQSKPKDSEKKTDWWN